MKDNQQEIELEQLYPDESWPLLLRNVSQMNVKCRGHEPLPGCGSQPESREITDYLSKGVIFLDKPVNPSSHEIVSWIKNILKVEKTGHCGTLDPKVSGCLIVTTGKATRLGKTQQEHTKEYVCAVLLDKSVKKDAFSEALAYFQGNLLQKPPLESAVKKVLRLRTVYSTELLDYKEFSKDGGSLALFRVVCEAGTYVRVLCTHLGLYLGTTATMADLRRVKSGIMAEEYCVTMHDVLDAMYVYTKTGNEGYLRNVVHPMEVLLAKTPKIVVKDTAVNALCYGGILFAPGILRYDNGIERGKEVAVVTTKGECVAIGIALIGTSEIACTDNGPVCRMSAVVMDRDVYPRCWKNKEDRKALAKVTLKKDEGE